MHDISSVWWVLVYGCVMLELRMFMFAEYLQFLGIACFFSWVLGVLTLLRFLLQCCCSTYNHWWERSYKLCISKLSWFDWQWEDYCKPKLYYLGVILTLLPGYLTWVNCRILVLVHWRNMVLVLVVHVAFMERLVCILSFCHHWSVLQIWKRNLSFHCGTLADVHLDCEAKIAKFLGTPDSILYSYGISTIFSVIPAFCKKGDIIVA